MNKFATPIRPTKKEFDTLSNRRQSITGDVLPLIGAPTASVAAMTPVTVSVDRKLETVSIATPVIVSLLNRENPARGYQYKLESAPSALSRNFRFSSEIAEGTAHDAFYCSQVPDEVIGATTAAGGGTIHYRFDADTENAIWHYRGGCPSDSVTVEYVQVSGGGTIEILRVRDGVELSVATVSTAGPSTNYYTSAEATLTATFMAGDQIKIQRTTGTARIQALTFWDSKSVPDGSNPILIRNPVDIVASAGGSVEFAHKFGSQSEFFGGFNHQGDYSETGTATYLLNGVEWTPSQGVHFKTFRLNRQSSADALDIDYEIDYLFSPFSLIVSHATTVTSAVAGGSGARYVAMVSIDDEVTTAVGNNGETLTLDATPRTFVGLPTAATIGPIIATGTYARLRLLGTNQTLSSVFVNHISNTYKKLYFTVATEAMKAGDTLRGAWQLDFVDSSNFEPGS